MPRYVVLIDWTEQGVRDFRASVDRYEAASGQLEALGIRFTDIYWTLGAHDIVSVVDAPDDETLAAGLLAVGRRQHPHDDASRVQPRRDARRHREGAAVATPGLRPADGAAPADAPLALPSDARLARRRRRRGAAGGDAAVWHARRSTGVSSSAARWVPERASGPEIPAGETAHQPCSRGEEAPRWRALRRWLGSAVQPSGARNHGLPGWTASRRRGRVHGTGAADGHRARGPPGRPVAAVPDRVGRRPHDDLHAGRGRAARRSQATWHGELTRGRRVARPLRRCLFGATVRRGGGWFSGRRMLSCRATPRLFWGAPSEALTGEWSAGRA